MLVIPSMVASSSAQYYGGGSESVTKEQQDFCIKYEIDPCTEVNILAKERVLSAQNTQYGNIPEGSGSPGGPTNTPSQTIGEATVTDNGYHPPQIPMDWSTIGIVIVSIVAVVAVSVVAIKIKRPATAEKV